MSDAQDIKKLMQQHIKHSGSGNQKEVDSPYAKYNSRGQLMCIVCGTVVKSKIIWQTHIIKRSHKENLTKLLSKQQEISNLQYKSANNNTEKRLLTQPTDDEPVKKKQHVMKPKGILKNFSSYKSSDEEESEEETVSHDIKPPSLPPVKIEADSDFVEDPSSKTMNHRLKSTDEDQESASQKKNNSLPEGFFDDPVADAKARNVEYVDKDEEEWLTFMKEVSVADVTSKKIIAEDKEEAAIETQMEQVTEQIRYFERVVEIDRANKNNVAEVSKRATDSDSDISSDEEFSTVIWRTKNSLI